ncbi:hypothetical protein [Candidatus Nitrosopumilus sediminis]|uniref:Uncharacterized protein n=1 Tax=Candidatus Nitrosopumilus sediminis TaxID=1229909 RepID=K0BDJ2_9ARCH|nr:hypothetical protein [Candidatus Nitrosopumilus sediminis]AFS83147.1 hypothetical protein NSED_06745 [Candidatus Nitrosopumilus sediminis]
MSDDYDKVALKQDLNLFLNSIDSNDFRTGNIIGNRIMSNAYLFEKQNYAIMGYFLKQICIDALSLKNRSDPDSLSPITSALKTFVKDKIFIQLDTQENLHELWKDYNNTVTKTRNSFLPPKEKELYKVNPQFTNKAFKKIISLLLENRDSLKYPTNNFFKGMLNEMNRIGKIYGTSIKDQHVLAIITMLDRVDEYVGLTVIDYEDFESRIEKEILPLVNSFEEVAINKNLDENLVNKFLWKLISIWRFNFIKFMEVKRAGVPQIQVQEEIKKPVKKQLVEEIAKSLEDEIGGK